MAKTIAPFISSYTTYIEGVEAIMSHYSAAWYAARATEKPLRKAHRALLAMARDLAREINEELYFPKA